MMRIPAPRLLPITIVVMAVLLAAKSVSFVLAAVPASAESRSPAPAAPASLATPVVTAKAAPPPNAAAPAAPVAAEAPPSDPPISASERALLLDLRKRRTEIEAKDAALAAREAVLSAAEHRLATRVEELTALQTRLEALEVGRKEHDESNWRGLVKLYETMKPRDAAVIFNDLDMSVLLQVVDRMKEAKAASVLAAMQPERARQVTAELAQMRARANTVAPPAASRANTDIDAAATKRS